MRVIAGAAKGHRLVGPPGRRTRPTSDRVKEALFSSLQTRLPQARVADLYAGSGALGIEALSRGAAHATFVEHDRAAHHTIKENLERTSLGLDAAVLFLDVRRALREGLPGGPFDLVLLDPPYDIDRDELREVLRLLATTAVLADDALVIVEAGRRGPEPAWPTEMSRKRVRRYGDTVLYEAGVVADGGVPDADE